VLFPDYRGAAAEREGGGPGGGVRRAGFADGIRSAGLRDAAVKGDDDLRDFVYDHVDVVVDCGAARAGVHRHAAGSQAAAEEQRAFDAWRQAGAQDGSRSSACGACTGEEVGYSQLGAPAEVAELADALA
jgi:hypothetical protein